MTSPDDHHAGSTSLIRAFAVAALASMILGINLPNIANWWIPWGYSGLSLDGYWVQTVDPPPGTAAAAAGLRAGDRVDLSGLSLEERLRITQGQQKPGDALQLRVYRDGTLRTVGLKIPPLYLGPIRLLKRIASLIFIAVGAALVLLRPSRMTWGFYLYGLTAADYNASFYAFLPPFWYYALWTVANLISSAQPVGALMFTTRFPRDEAVGWRRAVDRSAPYIWALLAAGSLYTSLAGVFFLAPTQWLSDASNWFIAGLYMVCAAALLATYLHTRGQDRQRIKWVVAGLAVGYAAALVGAVGSIARSAPEWVQSGYEHALNIFVPLTVAYAVLRHRVLDVNFVISRALVYGTLTTFLVAVFALIDWLLGKVLAQTQLALVTEIAAAVALGFWLNGLHRRVDYVIDRVLFRRRHLAERRLARVAAGLPHAVSPDAVDDMLVAEPADALSLASAALFRRNGEGHFVREAAVGWPQDSAGAFHPNDALVLHIQGERGALRVRDVRRTRTDLPAQAATPILAVPIMVRHQLVAIALYGAHSGGEDLDPDEERAIDRLAMGASAAYDHLESEMLKAQNDALRAQVDSLSTEVDAIRRKIQSLHPSAGANPA